jgi:hypothetical protein
METEYSPVMPINPSKTPKPGDLPPTLAGRVRFWREQRMFSPELLALKGRLPLRLVEDIESGLETFLSPAIRQRLARALHVRAEQIREVEKPPKAPSAGSVALQRAGVTLHEAILRAPDASHPCPACGAPLSVRLFDRQDLHGNPLKVLKAACTTCLFRLTDD